MQNKEARAIPVRFTRMQHGEIERLAELDRSEHITHAYKIRHGVLTRIRVNWDIPNWSSEGEGEHSLSQQLAFCRSHLEQGGVLLGAFKEDLLAGVAVVRPKIQEDMAQLAFLHVSQGFRRQGIAKKLFQQACEFARSAGACRIYVSATPSGSAVDFYLSQGCRLAETIDPDLYALEPEDIHLTLDL
jgi:ribosomal protein S18 acetylase RimI-like enzyme